MRSSSRTLLFTFLFALTLLIAFASQADANANVAASPAHRRQAGRMIRKRQLPPVIQVGSDPTQSSSTASGASATPAPSATSSGTTARPVTPTSASSDPLISIGVPSVSSITSTTTTSSVTTSTSATSLNATTSSTTSSSTTSSTTAETLSVTSAPDLTISSNKPTQTFTSTLSNADSSAATESATTTGATVKSIPKTTITIIAVVAASIGGAAIIWTIIRKWKFRPSAEFEDRMQPIDWSPESTHAQTGGPGLNRSASQASHGSFISGSEHGTLTGPRPYAPGTGNLVADIPPHDFTAGAAHLGGGYADLTRGPSPGPQMSQAVARDPSFNRGYGY